MHSVASKLNNFSLLLSLRVSRLSCLLSLLALFLFALVSALSPSSLFSPRSREIRPELSSPRRPRCLDVKISRACSLSRVRREEENEKAKARREAREKTSERNEEGEKGRTIEEETRDILLWIEWTTNEPQERPVVI